MTDIIITKKNESQKLLKYKIFIFVGGGYFDFCMCTQAMQTRITYSNNLALLNVLFGFNVACNSAPYPLYEFTCDVI